VTCISAHCPSCEAAGRPSLRKGAQGSERDEATQKTTYWVTIEHHSDGQGNLCPGSGRRV
jgi:hypothetical protein